MELAPLPQWQPVGENFTLHCKVKGGAPRDKLSVVLLRGKEVLDRRPVEGHPAEVTTTVLARREDHGASFSCHTELDLRTQSLGLFQNSSATRQLQTFGEALGSLQEDRFRWCSCLGCGVPGKEELQALRVLRREGPKLQMLLGRSCSWPLGWGVGNGVPGPQDLLRRL